MNRPAEALVLVGPTAAGKSAVAHHIARNQERAVLSADSMLIYRGMNVGTAKPSQQEQAEVPYFGIDLVTPEQRYTTGDYYSYVNTLETKERLIIAGGTGLYVKCLLYGMDELPPADPELREKLDRIMQAGGIEKLKEYARQHAPVAYQGLKDPDNPRRLVRMLEREKAGVVKTDVWEQGREQFIAGLRWPRNQLVKRIEQRVDTMYEEGLIEEARDIRCRYAGLSDTAAQAIGYREAFAVLDGTMSEKEAKEQTCIRTRRLAKRQMTWFRNQLDVAWVDVDENTSVEQIAKKVERTWQCYGPVELSVNVEH